MSILSSYVYDTIQTILRKDQKGNAFSISEFNRIAPIANFSLYNFYVANLEESQEVTEETKAFMTLNHEITLTSGVGSLPAYGRMLGVPYVISGQDTIPVDLLTNLELPFRLSDELTKPTALHPIAILGGKTGANKNITVYPASTSSVRINYLSIPATPVLDFYIDTNGLYVYLDQGETGVSIPAGAVYSDGTVGPTTKDSQTVDFEWHEDQVPMIISEVLQKAGLILSEQVAIEYGIARETKEETQ
jgi:hypothetical protein